MLVVDAQIHIWTGHKPTNANHRQVPDFTAAVHDHLAASHRRRRLERGTPPTATRKGDTRHRLPPLDT